MKHFSLASLAAAAVLAAGVASAAPNYTGTYKATDFSPAAGAHAVWLSQFLGGGTSDLWTLQNGRLDVDGTASTAALTGKIINKDDATKKFALDISLVLDPGAPPSTKCGGGCAGIGTFDYYTYGASTLTGAGSLSGLTLGLTQVGPEFQVGDGANDKNTDFGASGWFAWTILTNTTGVDYKSSGALGTHGDVNISLSAVPLPAAGLLLLGGLGGLGLMGRHRKV